MRTGLYFYYQKIQVFGTENIPKDGAVLFIGNHQNALLDALLVPTTNNRTIYFLTRASAFKNKVAKWWLSTVNMIPIYRIRDGRDSLQKNNAVFATCFEILKKGDALLIFPEGNHNIKHKVRPLSKGFTRILFGALEKYPDLQIKIVPIGFNYDYVTDYPSKVALYYGKPIAVNSYYDKTNLQDSIISIKEVCHQALRTLTVHIDDTENYNAIANHLEQQKDAFLNPKITNAKIQQIVLEKRVKPSVKKQHRNPLYILLIINTFIPWLFWKWLQNKIKEPEFIATSRFAIGISLAPIFWVLQAKIIAHFFGNQIAWYYLGISFLLVLLYTKIGIKKK